MAIEQIMAKLPKLLTAAQVADMLGLDETTVIHGKAGTWLIPCLILGDGQRHTRRYKLEDVENFIALMLVNSQSRFEYRQGGITYVVKPASNSAKLISETRPRTDAKSEREIYNLTEILRLIVKVKLTRQQRNQILEILRHADKR